MDFKNEVIALLAKIAGSIYGTDSNLYSGETSFTQDLQAKSVDIVRITAALEEEYDVEVPYMAFRRCETFAQAAEYMAELTGFC